jgi:hypothetical protein
MAYPQPPNFSIADNDSAWWKLTNPARGGTQWACQTNGAGFIAELRRLLNAWAVANSISSAVTRPDASSVVALNNWGATNRWNETLATALAAWYRVVSGATPVQGTPSYDQLVASLSPAEQAVHRQLANDFTAQRVGPVTLQVAAWCITYFKDQASGGRLGGAPANAVGPQLTHYDEVSLLTPVPPPWNVDVPGTPEAISCTQVAGVDMSLPVPGVGARGATRGLFDVRGLDTMSQAKLVGLVAAGGIGGWFIAKSLKKTRKRRNGSKSKAA